LPGFNHALHSETQKDNIKVTALVAGGRQTPFLLDRFPDIDPNLLRIQKTSLKRLSIFFVSQKKL